MDDVIDVNYIDTQTNHLATPNAVLVIFVTSS